MTCRYDGPRYGISGGWERPIAMYRTMFSFVLQSRDDTSDALGGTLWYGQGSPHGTVYVPFSCAQDSIPESYIIAKESHFDPHSSWWVFDFVNNWSMIRFNAINAEVRFEANHLQADAFLKQAQLHIKAKNMNNETNMQQFLQEENNRFAKMVFSRWWELAWRLVGKYSDGYITTGEAPEAMNMAGYPAWWLESTEFAKWPGDTYHPPQAKSIKMYTTSIPLHANPLEIAVFVCIGVVVGVFVIVIFQRARQSGGYSRIY